MFYVYTPSIRCLHVFFIMIYSLFLISYQFIQPLLSPTVFACPIFALTHHFRIGMETPKCKQVSYNTSHAVSVQLVLVRVSLKINIRKTRQCRFKFMRTFITNQNLDLSVFFLFYSVTNVSVSIN